MQYINKCIIMISKFINWHEPLCGKHLNKASIWWISMMKFTANLPLSPSKCVDNNGWYSRPYEIFSKIESNTKIRLLHWMLTHSIQFLFETKKNEKMQLKLRRWKKTRKFWLFAIHFWKLNCNTVYYTVVCSYNQNVSITMVSFTADDCWRVMTCFYNVSISSAVDVAESM